MKTIWAALGIFGGVCFLTMGLPLLLAVGVAALLSTSVWVPLLAGVVGVVGLAVSMAVSGRRRSCASAPTGQRAELDSGEMTTSGEVEGDTRRLDRQGMVRDR